MTDKNEKLNNEELNNVNGGDSCTPTLDYYESNFRCLVDNKYDVFKYCGEEVYLKYRAYNPGSSSTYGGVLLNSYEKSVTCGTERTFLVSVYYCSYGTQHVFNGEQREFSGDEWGVYVRALHN